MSNMLEPEQHGTVDRIDQLDHRLAAVIGQGEADAFQAAGANLHDQMIAIEVWVRTASETGRLQRNGNSNRLDFSIFMLSLLAAPMVRGSKIEVPAARNETRL